MAGSVAMPHLPDSQAQSRKTTTLFAGYTLQDKACDALFWSMYVFPCSPALLLCFLALSFPSRCEVRVHAQAHPQKKEVSL